MFEMQIPESMLTVDEEEKLFTANLSELRDLPMNHYPLNLAIVRDSGEVLHLTCWSKPSQEYEEGKLVRTHYNDRAGHRLTIFHDCEFRF
jgi:hypothetical protein